MGFFKCEGGESSSGAQVITGTIENFNYSGTIITKEVILNSQPKAVILNYTDSEGYTHKVFGILDESTGIKSIGSQVPASSGENIDITETGFKCYFACSNGLASNISYTAIV